MKELEMESEQLRLLVVAMVGREQGGCASGSKVKGSGGDRSEGDRREGDES